MPSSPLLSPGVSTGAARLHSKAPASPDPMPLNEGADADADAGAGASEPDWNADPVVKVVRADWRAMSVVHFILIFRETIGIPERLLLDCLPERAIAFACRLDARKVLVAHDESSPSAAAARAVDHLDEHESGGASQSPSRNSSASGAPQEPASDPGKLHADGDPEAAPLFQALVKFVAGEGANKRVVLKTQSYVLGIQNLAERIEVLKELVDKAAEFAAIRSRVCASGGKSSSKGQRRPRGAMGEDVPSGVRVTYGGRDGKGSRYVWIRGLEGCCSGRVERVVENGSKAVEEGSGIVQEGAEVEKMAEELELQEGALRTRRICAAWLREKVRRANARAEKVRKDAQRIEKSRLRNLGGSEVRIDGVLVTGENFGRGRRTRGAVTYREDDGDSEDIMASSDEEEDVVSRGGDDEDFVAQDNADDVDGESASENEGSDFGGEVLELSEGSEHPVKLGARRYRAPVSSRSGSQRKKRPKLGEVYRSDVDSEPSDADFAVE